MAQGQHWRGVKYLVLVTVMIFALLPGAGGRVALAAEGDLEFLDVPGWHWAGEYVYALAARRIVVGTRSGVFEPDRSISRAEFAKMVCAALGFPEGVPGTLSGIFSDVGENDWYAPFVRCVVERRIMVGSGGLFRPRDALTRAEAAVVLARLLVAAKGRAAWVGDQVGPADHASVPEWAQTAVGMARAWGIVGDYPDSTFRPFAEVSRGDAAVMVAKYMDVVGRLYDLIGTVEAVDELTGNATVSTAVGRVSVAVSYIWKGGVRGARVQLLDEVGLVMGDSGRVRHCSVVTWVDRGTVAWVERTTGTFGYSSQRDGRVRIVQLAPGAVVFRHGRQCELSNVQPGDDVGIVFERLSGRARIVDARRINAVGTVELVDGGSLVVKSENGQDRKRILVPETAVILLNGKQASVSELKTGDRLLLWVQNGNAYYIEAFRFEAGV